MVTTLDYACTMCVSITGCTLQLVQLVQLWLTTQEHNRGQLSPHYIKCLNKHLQGKVIPPNSPRFSGTVPETKQSPSFLQIQAVFCSQLSYPCVLSAELVQLSSALLLVLVHLSPQTSSYKLLLLPLPSSPHALFLSSVCCMCRLCVCAGSLSTEPGTGHTSDSSTSLLVVSMKCYHCCWEQWKR